MTRVASRIVNDFSYVMRINHEIHFAWQAQYLVKLEDDSCCSAHCRDCSPCAETFVAAQCARCCGLRVVFVASDRPSILFPLRRARRCGLRVVFIASDNPSISFALPCCIRLPKTVVALQCMIFFYRLTCFL